ncbi:hypothetical protein [Desulfotalea psychrophila]|uniref:hypothetical protein n=1 Tax=Desulfotalea psychrophila TaxID=84980 RepID=UPI00059B6437|nr:hypothetical protein [Desulfotalea psychrophila]
MFNANELCNKITSLHPELGACGIDITVTKDDKENRWLVHLNKGEHSLNHFLEMPDADHCMEGQQCLSLGLEIAQLQKNIKGEQF